MSKVSSVFSSLKTDVFKTILKPFSQFFCQNKQAVCKQKNNAVAMRTVKHLSSIRPPAEHHDRLTTEHFVLFCFTE